MKISAYMMLLAVVATAAPNAAPVSGSLQLNIIVSNDDGEPPKTLAKVGGKPRVLSRQACAQEIEIISNIELQDLCNKGIDCRSEAVNPLKCVNGRCARCAIWNVRGRQNLSKHISDFQYNNLTLDE